MDYTLELDLCVESDEELRSRLGQVDTAAGFVIVAPTGQQPATEIVTVKITGSVPAIIQWMINEWQDTDEAIKALVEAADAGRLYAA